jgi:pilus assembly protein CpaC
MLAEPSIVALSGQEAKFHAGGEIPVLVSQQLGQVSVQFKKFGVMLNFVPTVLGARTMSLKVAAEVSEPDATKGVALGGYQIPGFKTRSSETTVRLKDGQSFAVAGLLSDDIRTTIRKIPLLGELPILGALFRSTAFQREETELLVVVRARLVQPLQPDQAGPMPGELELNDLDDFQLFLLGRIDGGQRKEQKDQGGKADEGSPEEPGQPGSKAAGPGGPLGPIGFVHR